MTKAIEVIAHSCGVEEVRLLNRTHVRIVQTDGKSIPMDELSSRYHNIKGEDK